MAAERFDALVVGSGFGGSAVACRLAEAGLDVCVLERGRAYPPGSFPRGPAGMRDNFWDPSDGSFGLFNAWSFRGIEALVGAGLGGGSLIYANVLLRKDERWFVQDHRDGGYEHWPVTRADLDPYYARAEEVLEPTHLPFGREPYSRLRKTHALREAADAAGLDWGLAPLAVTFASAGRPGAEPGVPIEGGADNLHGRGRLTCLLCGECDIGCNYGSKNTLDFNYLSRADRAGASIRPLSEVKRLGPDAGGGWFVDYVDHSEHPASRGLGPPAPERIGERAGEDRRGRALHRVRAGRLVLSAGTLGSTWLLLSNRERLPALSDRIGSRFSGNGDLLGFFLGARTPDRRPRALDPHRGPVITSFARAGDELDGDGSEGRGFYIEDGGHPEFLSWLVEASQVPGVVRRALRFALGALRRRLSGGPESDVTAHVRELLGDAALSSGSLPVLGMGRDVPDGTMRLREGWLDLDWTLRSSEDYFERMRDAMRVMARALGARFADNPTWYLKRVVTVHPLGGCPMGRGPEEGVVDDRGAVFGHPGLWVADGSVMPGPVGPNPALTIAAMGERTAEAILEGC